MPEFTGRKPVTLPNYNQDQAVHDFAETAGAHVGGLITAGITGIFNLGAGLFRGAVEGALNTYQQGALDAQRKMEAANGGPVEPTAEELEAIRQMRAQRVG